MLLPNKVIPFKESVISYFPSILTELENKDMTAKSLYDTVKSKIKDIGVFLEVLDSLYALGKIDFNKEEGMLHYVG
jgi:hypothetical protein